MSKIPKSFFYRRKILLSLIQALGGSVPKTKFQKLLFLLSEEFEKKPYEFTPYKFGCFSFQSYEDMRILDSHYKLIKMGNKIELRENAYNYFDMIKDADLYKILSITKTYNSTKISDIIRFVYNEYPYYAINSEIKDKYISKDKKMEIELLKEDIVYKKVLYTIGYEGKSIDNYMNSLIKNKIKVLVDVRKNPLSMKYGFHKKQLSSICDQLKIKYVHIPELGIESEKRVKLNSAHDYEILLNEYENKILPKKSKYLKDILDLFNNYNKVALTCFEADPNYCHRSKIQRRLKEQFVGELKNI